MGGAPPARHPTERPCQVGIVVALATEARHLGAALPRADDLALLRSGILLAVTGIGRDAAARGARQLVGAGCRALASWGLAGGLDPALSPGAILVPEEVILDASGGSLRATPVWRQRVVGSLAARVPVEGGALLTSRQTLETVADKAAAFRETGAVAVDMESYAVAEVAQAHGLAFLAVRVVLDGASDELPHALEGVTSPSGEVSVGRLLARLVSQPASLGPLLKLAGRYRVAARALRAVARTGALGSYG